MIKLCDSHLHIGDYNEISKILDTSIYRDKYKVYSCIEKKVLLDQEKYVSTLEGFFAIPHVFKEIDVKKNNKYILDYCKNNKNGVPVLLIENNDSFTGNYETKILKEHFLLNRYDDYKKRRLFYDYLSENNGYLLVHCKDKIRVEYINCLLNNYPNMNIIVAHLGRDVYEDSFFINNVLDNFKSNDRVLFDISTIHNIDNIKNSINTVGNERIMYGSDFPFEIRNYESYKKSIELILDSFDYRTSERLLSGNFERIRKKVYVRK